MNLINTWQFNLIAYLFFIVLFFQCYKLAVRHTKRDGAATILLQIIAGVSILFVAPFSKLALAVETKYWILLFLACVFYALNDRLQTTARKHLPVSTYSIVNQLTTVFLVLLGLLIFKEPLVISKLFGTALILLANLMLIYKKGNFRIDKNVAITILATFVFSIAISVDIGISERFNLPFYIMLTLIIPAFMILFTERITTKEILAEYESPNKKYYLLTGVAWGLAILFSLRAYQLGDITTVVPLQATAVILNVLAAYILQNEREDRMKKIIAACLVVAGVYFTVF